MSQYSPQTLEYIGRKFPTPSPLEILEALAAEQVSPFDTDCIRNFNLIRAEVTAMHQQSISQTPNENAEPGIEPTPSEVAEAKAIVADPNAMPEGTGAGTPMGDQDAEFRTDAQ